jgi:RNA polymerase primary sigma factor
MPRNAAAAASAAPTTTPLEELLDRGRSQGHLSLDEVRKAFHEAGITPAQGRSIIRELTDTGVRLASEDKAEAPSTKKKGTGPVKKAPPAKPARSKAKPKTKATRSKTTRGRTATADAPPAEPKPRSPKTEPLESEPLDLDRRPAADDAVPAAAPKVAVADHPRRAGMVPVGGFEDADPHRPARSGLRVVGWGGGWSALRATWVARAIRAARAV